MKSPTFGSRAAAILCLLATVEAVGHGHNHLYGRHSWAEVAKPLEKKGGQCQFPTNAGLVSVTPNAQNAGWAMSPDQPCQPGNFCPYACPPGEVSMQWDPQAVSYSYPLSMHGGLFCDENGNIQKPFPDKPYCQPGTGSVSAVNKCGQSVAFCQTVLPGNEAMLIPTLVSDLATLAVPDTSYWCGTAAHFYVNPPGIPAEVACVWGTSSNNYGNWSPYVAGANTDHTGNTFVKIGWNPIYLQPSTPFRNVVPEFGVEIICEGDGCNGLPCKIDPSVNGVNEMVGSSTDGAGGAAFCVVTVPSGGKANIVVFEKSGGNENVSPSSPSSSSSSSASSTSTSTSASTYSSTSTPTASMTTTSAPSTPWTSSSPTPYLGASGYGVTSAPSGSGVIPSASGYAYAPHVFLESSSSATAPTAATTSSGYSPGATTSSQGAAPLTTVSVLSLGLGFLVAAIFSSF